MLCQLPIQKISMNQQYTYQSYTHNDNIFPKAARLWNPYFIISTKNINDVTGKNLAVNVLLTIDKLTNSFEDGPIYNFYVHSTLCVQSNPLIINSKRDHRVHSKIHFNPKSCKYQYSNCHQTAILKIFILILPKKFNPTTNNNVA